MKIILINPPIDKGYMSSLRTGVYPPLNLAVLAGYILKKNPNWSVEILDGDIESLEMIKYKLYADIIGISSNTLNYKSTIEIAEAASKKKIKVILGGPYPSKLPELILKNRPFIDSVVVGDGEIALSKILNGEVYENIPNLVYRKNNQIIVNKYQKTPFSQLSKPEYCNLDLDQYFLNHQIRYGEFKPYNGTLPVYSMKGCEWRDNSNGGCLFCMIPHYGIRYKSPVNYWTEIKFLKIKYGINSFWDVSDSFVDNEPWLRALLLSKPSKLDISLQVYGRPNKINEEKASLLKKIGVKEVFIGADSGDDRILRNSNKGSKTQHTLSAINHLTESNINVVVSFVLGLLGETQASLQNTINFSKHLSSFDRIREASVSILFPIPGSKVFEMLMSKPELKNKYKSDIIDFESLKNDWVDNFTFVKMLNLEEALTKINSYFPLNNTFSRPKCEIYSAMDC